MKGGIKGDIRSLDYSSHGLYAATSQFEPNHPATVEAHH